MEIAALYVYPVKACRGLAVDRWPLTAGGLAWDRRWMIVDERGRFLTQRDRGGERLALVEARFVDAAGRALSAAPSFAASPEAGASLELRATGRPPLLVDLHPELDRPRREVEIWGFRGPAVDEGEAAASWLSAWVGQPLRLVRVAPEHARRAGSAGDPSTPLAFADAYPLLAIGERALAELGDRLRAEGSDPVTMDRFRPNLVLRGEPEAHAEDRWARVHVHTRTGPVELRGTKACDRCAVTQVDQATGTRGEQPLKTLADYRKARGKLWFGMNFEPRLRSAEATGELAIGDRIEVLERRSPELGTQK